MNHREHFNALRAHLIGKRGDTEVHPHAFAVAVETHYRDEVGLVYRDESVSQELAVSSVP